MRCRIPLGTWRGGVMSALGRRFRRASAGATWPASGATAEFAAADLADRHLLLLPTTVGVDVVSALVRDRIPDADLAAAGEVSLGRHSQLSGPYDFAMEDAVAAAVPMPWTLGYALDAPVEREGPPLGGMDDRDGFAFAFP